MPGFQDIEKFNQGLDDMEPLEIYVQDEIKYRMKIDKYVFSTRGSTRSPHYAQ